MITRVVLLLHACMPWTMFDEVYVHLLLAAERDEILITGIEMRLFKSPNTIFFFFSGILFEFFLLQMKGGVKTFIVIGERRGNV